MGGKFAVEYRLDVPMGGVALTGGRLKRAFDDNIAFLKRFDLDRMLYWYRVHAGKDAPGVPYADGAGHFENNLKGQTAGEFLMGACTALLWQQDETLARMSKALLNEIEACRDADGFVIPVSADEFHTREYPNYTRAWITFGLLDAGFAGFEQGFRMARDMGDWFNRCDVLPYVKDMNLGFQGILANTRLYTSPVGAWRDAQVAIDHYQETWWLEQLIQGDHRAIYDHPGNHPHSTLLTTLEGYLDLYLATGQPIYLDAVKSALPMYEAKWQHVGGGISMCEFDTYWPGCNWLSPKRHYNELCSTNFWMLLNQRMHRLFPLNAHYVDEIETSLYNVLLASQVEDRGFHYLNFLERTKDARWQDKCTCCASLGTRLMGLLPQFLFSTDEAGAYVDIYAPSQARLSFGGGMASLRVETDLPERGNVRVTVEEATAPFALRLRIPRWAAGAVTVLCNGAPVTTGLPSSYVTIEAARAGDVFEFSLPMDFKTTLYTGGDEIPGKQRWAVEYGPLLYAAMGAPSPVELHWDVHEPAAWLTPMNGEGPRFTIRGDSAHEYWAYLDIADEPFSVYPVIE